MWNLEQTEQLVLRVLPIVVCITLALLIWMSYTLDPHRLSPAFATPQPTAVVASPR